MTIHEKLSLIQKEFKAKKSRYNSFGKYNFRSAEDILEALKPVNEKHGVYFTVTEELIENMPMPIIKSTASIFDNKGDKYISATAVVGVDLNQKGMQAPQQFGSASSYAKKCALGNLLLIDDTADADATNDHGKSFKRETLNPSNIASKNTKPLINMNNIDQAKKYLSNGGQLKTLEDKYTITKEVRESLING